MNIEGLLLHKLLEEQDYKIIKEQQIDSSFFEGVYKNVFVYIQDVYTKVRELPTLRVVKSKYPNAKLEDGEESLRFLCEELRLKNKHNKTADLLEDVAEILAEGKSLEGFTQLKEGLGKIDKSFTVTEEVDITKDTEDRVEKYLERKKNKGIVGLRSGFPTLDRVTGGFVESTLTTIMAKSGVGKAQPLDTLILTPKGFIKMREVEVGTLVIGEDGKSYKVNAIYPQGVKEVYEICFKDGTSTKCCKEHLWKFKTTDDLVRKKEWRVDTLENITKKFGIKRGKSFNLNIPVSKPVEFEPLKKELPIDPYVLGCLLGDGCFTSPTQVTFSNPEEDIMLKLQEKLKEQGNFRYHKGTNCQYYFKSNTPKVNLLFRNVRSLGLGGKLSKDKFIPKEYLHSSIQERKELLKGLFDTDGHITDKCSCAFFSTSPSLIEDVAYLCKSLGYRCKISSYDRTHDDKGVEYKLIILTKDIIFSSKKHEERYNKYTKKGGNLVDYSLLKVTGIRKVGSEECQCISIDSKEHTYLCNDFIVTHNTWIEVIMGAEMQLNNLKVLQFVTEMSSDVMRDRYEAILFSKMYGSFNYGSFKSGNLDSKTEKDFFRFLREDLPCLEPLKILTATDILSIQEGILEEDPDIVFIDGVYLMQDIQGAKEDWKRVTNITRGLKLLAKNLKKPIVMNTQTDLKSQNGGIESVKYAQAIIQDSDVVLELWRNSQHILDKEAQMKVLKNREGIPTNITSAWDFKHMNFDEIYSETAEGAEAKEEDDVPVSSAILGVEEEED